ncbi:MAG: co-chaperone GroES [Gammaproteobacteria bacterium]|nr:co-chaperone GroES [Gammaproteobacteria bacterium]
MKAVEIASIQPLRDGMIVKREESQQTTAGGIVLPGNAQETSQWGVVVKVGPGKRCGSSGNLCPMAVKAGDRVLFGQYAGTKFKVDHVEYLLLKEDDVMAVSAS